MTITTASAPAGRGEKNEQPTADLWRRLKSKTSRASQRLKVGRSTGPQKGRDLCLFGDWLLEFFINGVRYAVDGRLIEAEILTESFGRERGLFDCFFFFSDAPVVCRGTRAAGAATAAIRGSTWKTSSSALIAETVDGPTMTRGAASIWRCSTCAGTH